jgi:hypothetical protein
MKSLEDSVEKLVLDELSKRLPGMSTEQLLGMLPKASRRKLQPVQQSQIDTSVTDLQQRMVRRVGRRPTKAELVAAAIDDAGRPLTSNEIVLAVMPDADTTEGTVRAEISRMVTHGQLQLHGKPRGGTFSLTRLGSQLLQRRAASSRP